MGVPVYKRILDLFEAEGVNTLFGIPDPNFVHMFAEADARGCTRTYWTTQEFNYRARSLYDQVATKSPFLQYRR